MTDNAAGRALRDEGRPVGRAGRANLRPAKITVYPWAGKTQVDLVTGVEGDDPPGTRVGWVARHCSLPCDRFDLRQTLTLEEWYEQPDPYPTEPRDDGEDAAPAVEEGRDAPDLPHLERIFTPHGDRSEHARSRTFA